MDFAGLALELGASGISDLELLGRKPRLEIGCLLPAAVATNSAYCDQLSQS